MLGSCISNWSLESIIVFCFCWNVIIVAWRRLFVENFHLGSDAYRKKKKEKKKTKHFFRKTCLLFFLFGFISLKIQFKDILRIRIFQIKIKKERKTYIPHSIIIFFTNHQETLWNMKYIRRSKEWRRVS